MGWGGSCFGKDVNALLHTAREYGYEGRLLSASLDVNAAQRMVAIQKLQEKLYILKGRTIAVLGLAFKPDTDDLRDAPSLHMIERLLQFGARVKAYDPIAMDACRAQHPTLKIKYCDSALECAREADALVMVTEWAEFRQPRSEGAGGGDGAADYGGRAQYFQPGRRISRGVSTMRASAAGCAGRRPSAKAASPFYMPFERVCSLDELPPNSVLEVLVRDEPYAICNVNGEITALYGICPHAGGPLGQGQVEKSGRIVCPYHMWEFDCRDGPQRLCGKR